MFGVTKDSFNAFHMALLRGYTVDMMAVLFYFCMTFTSSSFTRDGRMLVSVVASSLQSKLFRPCISQMTELLCVLPVNHLKCFVVVVVSVHVSR